MTVYSGQSAWEANCPEQILFWAGQNMKLEIELCQRSAYEASVIWQT